MYLHQLGSQTASRRVPALQSAEPSVLCRIRRNVSGTAIWIEVSGTEDCVHQIVIDSAGGALSRQDCMDASLGLAKRALQEIDMYLSDPVHAINLPLLDHADKQHTQSAAMGFLRSIPCGQTRSYAQQAQAVRTRCGGGFNARNAGNANRSNHYPLAIPCHRVVRTGGDVGGFMGSTKDDARALKTALLRHERAL